MATSVARGMSARAMRRMRRLTCAARSASQVVVAKMIIDAMRPGLPSPAAAMTKKLTTRSSRTRPKLSANRGDSASRRRRLRLRGRRMCWSCRPSSGGTVSQSGRRPKRVAARREPDGPAICGRPRTRPRRAAGARGGGRETPSCTLAERSLSPCRTATTPRTRRAPTATAAAAGSAGGGVCCCSSSCCWWPPSPSPPWSSCAGAATTARPARPSRAATAADGHDEPEPQAHRRRPRSGSRARATPSASGSAATPWAASSAGRSSRSSRTPRCSSPSPSTRSPRGICRYDFFNWQQQIETVVKTAKPQAAVIMMGTNDTQSVSQDGEWISYGDMAWKQAYEKRVGDIIDTHAQRRRAPRLLGRHADHGRGLAQLAHEAHQQDLPEAGREAPGRRVRRHLGPLHDLRRLLRRVAAARDQVHFTGDGQALLAEKVYKAIKADWLPPGSETPSESPSASPSASATL